MSKMERINEWVKKNETIICAGAILFVTIPMGIMCIASTINQRKASKLLDKGVTSVEL